MERIAGDICKLAYPNIEKIGVMLSIDNPGAYEFHLKAGAVKVSDPLYHLEYRLNDPERPHIDILPKFS